MEEAREDDVEMELLGELEVEVLLENDKPQGSQKLTCMETLLSKRLKLEEVMKAMVKEYV